MIILTTRHATERRRETRRDYSGFIFFATQHQVSEGTLKNFSRCGVFILSDISVEIGHRITIALPHTDDKRSGRIIWLAADGFGVALEESIEATAAPARLYHRISSKVIRLFRSDA